MYIYRWNLFLKKNIVIMYVKNVELKFFLCYWYVYCIYLECDVGIFGYCCEKVCLLFNYENFWMFKCDYNEDFCNFFNGCLGKWCIKYCVVGFFLKGLFLNVCDISIYKYYNVKFCYRFFWLL